jgi:hypothetical protein
MDLGNWLAEQIITEDANIKRIIAVYPGRYQPFGQHHATAFRWLQTKFGKQNTFIATSDKVDPVKSPFSFKEKRNIIKQYGITQVVQVKDPYKAEELLSRFNPETTAVVFMVGAKDMQESPRFRIGQLKSGKDSYFQDYKANKDNLQGYDQHGYLIVAPHVSLDVPGFGEMSGTQLRKALKRSTPEEFEQIMGWYNPNVYKNIKSKLTEHTMKLKQLLREILTEGGAGGHMSHPFDIPSVKTGKDLYKVFELSVDYLKKGPASVKIDGVNASIRLINIDGKRQFVMDRGSNKPLDVKGITKAELGDRFGAGHGLIVVGGKVLDIFNDAMPDIAPFLKKLGMWDNPNIMFNIEYVAGSTNVLSYNKNFLAIHGLLEIEQVTPKRRATKEISYNKKALQDLLNALAPTANASGYEVLGSVPTTLDKEPNFEKALNKRYTVIINGEEVSKTLKAWLADARNEKDTFIKLASGKVVGAQSKQVLMAIANKQDVADLVADPADIEKAVNGFVIYIATMKLGDAVLESLNSPLGPVSEHEGIVIRDPKIYSKPFKITGKFILQGLESAFG